jgi:FecR protein
MKKNLLFAASIAVLGLLFSTFVFAQDDKVVSAAGETYVISAKAGGVNYVEGKVAIVRKDGKSGLLLKSDTLEIGDKISTGADGKAEILLNPGSFVRLGANAEFEFVSTDLENLKLKLSNGSAIFEVYADDEFKVLLDLPKADIELTKSGVFRVDVLADGSGKISVWKGKVIVGDDKAEVKGGKSAIVSNKTTTIAKFDRDNKDEFDIWSQTRAKEASKINARLQKQALSNSLLNSFNRGGWNMYNTFGLWVFDRFTGRWCFLPFGSGWNSPYGYGYGFDIWNCRMPQYVYYNPPVVINPPTTGGGGTPTSAQIREARRETTHTPTFQRFENNQRSESRGGSTNNDNGGGNTQRDDSGNWNTNRRTENDSRPTFTPSTPTQSTPTQSTPPIMPTRTETKDNVKDN